MFKPNENRTQSTLEEFEILNNILKYAYITGKFPCEVDGKELLMDADKNIYYFSGTIEKDGEDKRPWIHLNNTITYGHLIKNLVKKVKDNKELMDKISIFVIFNEVVRGEVDENF